MKKHNGMRPQDIVVLLKIVAMGELQWRHLDIVNGTGISPSEVSEAINRCKLANLIDSKKTSVHINAFKEFLIYGLKYVFPTEPGAVVVGIPTAHSASPIKEHIVSDEIFVWSSAKGTHRGQAIEPLYKTVPEYALEDSLFYELLVIVDTIRVGRAREINIAKEELEKRLNYA